jgi:hypothetical protein
MRVEHQHERGGALASHAAWDLHRARLFGRLEPTTGIEPFGRLVEQIMTVRADAAARPSTYGFDGDPFRPIVAQGSGITQNYGYLVYAGGY